MKCIETYVTLCAVCYINILWFQRPGFGRKKSKPCQIWIEVLRTMYSLDSLLFCSFLHLCASVMICTYISINMESLPFGYACVERLNRGITHIFFKTFCCKSISLRNPWAMAIAIQSLVLTFDAMHDFLVCNIRDNTFSDRNTSLYHMSRELIVTKISILNGVSIRHSIMIKVKSS